MDYQIPSCIPACETNICWTGVNNIMRCIRPWKKTEVMMDMYHYGDEAKMNSRYYDLRWMDRGSQGQEKEEACEQDVKRQKQDMQKMKRNGKHELHSTLDVQRKLWVHVWIGCCIANGYSHPINRHVIPNCRKY